MNSHSKMNRKFCLIFCSCVLKRRRSNSFAVCSLRQLKISRNELGREEFVLCNKRRLIPKNTMNGRDNFKKRQLMIILMVFHLMKSRTNWRKDWKIT
jgi:hypothetical protein